MVLIVFFPGVSYMRRASLWFGSACYRQRITERECIFSLISPLIFMFSTIVLWLIVDTPVALRIWPIWLLFVS